eukprot:GEZU01009228.1.p1 GENE.GEZU01009228.1~~GEZU01009228.1.p1  ORF type:complete len:120 (+),score=16.73 GEZU01009228.1:164-523(+)
MLDEQRGSHEVGRDQSEAGDGGRRRKWDEVHTLRTPTTDVFDKTYAYVQRFGKYKSHEIVDSIRDLLERNNLQEFEIAALCNLSPETTEEAKALLPSLNRFPDADLQGILEDLETYRNA